MESKIGVCIIHRRALYTGKYGNADGFLVKGYYYLLLCTCLHVVNSMVTNMIDDGQ